MSRHPRRRRAFLALLAGLLTLGAAAPAARATGGGPGDPPEPPEPAADFTITGTVSLVRCTTTAANVQVTAHGTTYPFEDKKVTAFTSNGAIKYSVTKLPRGTYRVSAATINGKCLYGTSTATFVSSGNVANVTKTANVTYSGPHGTKVVGASSMSSAFNASFFDMSLALSNYTPQRVNQSNQASNTSVAKYPNTAAWYANIPEVVGFWNAEILKMYAFQVYMTDAKPTWNNGGIDLKLSFEADGDEVESIVVNPPTYQTVTAGEWNHNWVNMTITVRMIPVVDGQGQLTYAVLGTPKFNATPEDQCVHIDPNTSDPCPTVDAMLDTLAHGMANATKDLLNKPIPKAEAAKRMTPLVVPAAAVGHLAKVIVRSGDVVLVW